MFALVLDHHCQSSPDVDGYGVCVPIPRAARRCGGWNRNEGRGAANEQLAPVRSELFSSRRSKRSLPV